MNVVVLLFHMIILRSTVQANYLLKDKFGKSLLNIYKHYTEISERRRHQELATENNLKSQKKNLAVALQERMTPEMKALQKKLKHTLGYNEFFKVPSICILILLFNIILLMFVYVCYCSLLTILSSNLMLF